MTEIPNDPGTLAEILNEELARMAKAALLVA
jgi:hypothetical protein